MKKLFRDRKTSIDSKPRPVVSIPAPLGGADTPLYARFATVTRGQDGGSPTKPVVSGPMQLSSRASFSRGQSNGAAAAPVGVKSRGGERQAHGTGPILGRSSQDAVKPQKLHRMPSKAGQEMASPPSINRMAQMEQRPQVIASPPLNQSSRPLPASPIRDEPWGAYPHIQSPVPPTNGYYGQNPPASRLERMPTESASSLTSDSFSYSPPHRQLVVRNFDPDNDSLPDAVVRPTPATGYSYPQAPLSPPVLPKPLDISSPLLRPSHLHQSGFDLQPPPLSHTATKEHRYPGPSRAAHIPVHDHKPSVSNIPLNNGIASSSIPQHPPQPTLHNTRTAPLHTPALDQHDSHESRPQPPPNRQASLLATPSVRRKKYSPLAAFGLPATQTGSTPSLAASTSSASGHDDVVPSDDNKNSSPLPAPESHDVPLLPPLDVSSSSFQLPLLDIDLGDWRKTATERASRRASRADSPAKRISKIPSIPPSPASPPQSQLPEIDEQGFLREQILDDATVTASRPQGLTYTAPIPIHPPTQPGALTSQLSTSLQSTSSTSHSPAPPSETISVASRGEMPDVGDTRFQNTGERSPALPVKSHQGLSRSYEDNEETRAPTQYQQQPERKTPPSEQQNSTMRRGPLIFAAMEATEMSEVHNIYVEPEMVGFIGGVSAAAKAEEAYTFGPHASYQTPNSTPPPPPEKEEKIHSRKLSKPKREHSSRKTDVAKEDVVQNHSHSRHGSSRTVVYNSVAEGSSVQHRSAPAPTNQPGPSSRTREETERQSSDVERHARRPSVSSENKLKRRSRDGVKALTEKQMEKLSNRKSYTDVPQRPSEPQASSSRRPTPVEQTTAYPPPPHKLSYKSTAPFIPTQPAEPSTIPPPHHAKRTHHAGQLSLSTENGSRHASPQLPTPPEEYTPSAPKKPRRQKKSASPPATRDQHAALSPEIKREPQSYPLVVHLAHTVLLEELLSYLTYFEWLTLASVSKEVRRTLFEDGRESVLERYLRTVGYTRWIWDTPEPLKLRVEDLCHYMRGVSIPIHQYSTTAIGYLQPHSQVRPQTMQEMTFACRAFTRVVLRLRVQAEMEAMRSAQSSKQPTNGMSRPRTLSSSAVSHRAPSKWSSQTSISVNMSRPGSRAPSPSPSSQGITRYNSSATAANVPGSVPFHSPLFRLRRAPLLHVFVPSPDGDWLSDASILECEAELKRAGVTHLLRAGDVVWDVAVGDEANIGRLVWDGNYLIDLDFTYSSVGDAPRYLPTLAFPPSYFHRVIRTMGTGNPIVRIDISPWADQIHANMQLIQDKMRTDTPQGGRHMVVRWVHRSSFAIRPPPGSKSIRLPMPSTAGPGPSPTGAWIVDPGWFGTVVVETEGTNEGLADLKARCRPVMPQRGPVSPEQAHWEERRLVYRILRERSRPGEICIRVVDEKERIIPP